MGGPKEIGYQYPVYMNEQPGATVLHYPHPEETPHSAKNKKTQQVLHKPKWADLRILVSMSNLLESVAHLCPVSSPTQAKNQPVSGNKSFSDLVGGEQKNCGEIFELGQTGSGKKMEFICGGQQCLESAQIILKNRSFLVFFKWVHLFTYFMPKHTRPFF